MTIEMLEEVTESLRQVAQNVDVRRAWNLMNSRETFHQLSQALGELCAVVARLGKDLGVEPEKAEEPACIDTATTALHTHAETVLENTIEVSMAMLYKVQCQDSSFQRRWYTTLEAAEAKHQHSLRTIEKKHVVVCRFPDGKKLILEGDVVEDIGEDTPPLLKWRSGSNDGR